MAKKQLRANEAELLGDQIARQLALGALQLADSRDHAQHRSAQQRLDVARMPQPLIELIGNQRQEDSQEQSADHAGGLHLHALVIGRLLRNIRPLGHGDDRIRIGFEILIDAHQLLPQRIALFLNSRQRRR
jgi:hypothetical protein